MADNDQLHLEMLRANIERFLSTEAQRLYPLGEGGNPDVLEIGDEGRGYGRRFFPGTRQLVMDLNPDAACEVHGDICHCPNIPDESFDVVICTEVLEHTRAPWAAAEEIRRTLRPGGTVLVTTPCNLYIHSPAPDCWRFLHDGLLELFRYYSTTVITGLETPGRYRFPIQYQVVAKK